LIHVSNANQPKAERQPSTEGWMSEPVRAGVVSVLIPAYNRERYIAKSLDSVCLQTFRPIEIVVVDDGSTDETAAAIRRWNDQQNDDKLKVVLVQQSNQGADAARNAAMQASSGEFVQFLDSDDLLHPSKLSECMKEFSDTEVDTVVGQFQIFCELQEVAEKLSKAPEHREFRLDGERRPFYTRMGWELWVPMFRRKLLQSAGPMRVGIRAGGAFAYTTVLKLHSKKRAYVPLVLNFYRRGVDNALTGIGNLERVPATASVMQWIHDSLLSFGITDRAEWKDFTLKSLNAYRKSLAVGVEQGRAQLYALARDAAWRWNPLAGTLLSPSEPIMRAILMSMVRGKRLFGRAG